jgi:hypothetical protein
MFLRSIVFVLCILFPGLSFAQTNDGLPIDRLRGCKWIEGLPKGIEGKMEITPKMICDRLFFLRVTITNKTGKPVDMLESIGWTDQESGYHIDVKSKDIPSITKQDITFITNEDAGMILKPHRLNWNSRQPQFSAINNDESRILFLGPIMMGGLGTKIYKKINASNPKLRFAFWGKEENLSGSMSIPIQFKKSGELFDILDKEEEKILQNKMSEMEKKASRKKKSIS